MDDLGIVEVVETMSRSGCNAYIEHGYVLLEVVPAAWWKDKGVSGYVAKGVQYVLGRRANVEPWELPRKEPVAVGAPA